VLGVLALAPKTVEAVECIDRIVEWFAFLPSMAEPVAPLGLLLVQMRRPAQFTS